MEEMMENMMCNNASPMSVGSYQNECIIASPYPKSGIASCPDPFDNLPATRENCICYIEDPFKRVVAYGRVYKLGGMLHNQPLSKDNVRVVVDKVIIPDAVVPYRNDELQTVNDAPGQFIPWPKLLVELGTKYEVQTRRNVNGQMTKQSSLNANCPLFIDVTSVPREFGLTKTLADELHAKECIDINMDSNIVGIQYAFHIDREEILRFLRMETIDLGSMMLFCMCIYNHFDLRGSKNYGFLCPRMIQEKTNDSERVSYLTRILLKGTRNCYLC
ncbi:unnamed protein product [Cuscuta epithymum]|uniref:DUF8039 domain-containing protein n=1 Tax=Cuscuta epithymum TaxID=186058 RepID=A0AAV0EYQ8_9ASTE|nr:unnamed protein product [Cuscuta epithymum]